MKYQNVFLAAFLTLFLGACSFQFGGPGGDSGGGSSDGGSSGGGGSGGEATAGEAGAIASREGIESGTVQISAEGSFVDPASGEQTDSAGSGSGFIIDPSGIAVTNNHVVTGSAFLNVFVGGSDEPTNARLLGVSECSDLAVIDLEGEGYPYFDWHTGDIETGLDIYAAGFPLGDPEFTLTRGIVSKAEADGETAWASVDNVIEHDATINPGNSGGPLVDENGKVVGINYAGSTNDVASGEANQYFAISEAEALDTIEQLRSGKNVNSIGVNGEAVIAEDESVSGVYVYSVESGSPADRAGVRGGDFITRLEGKTLADDGTMADYCDVLRSNAAEDTLSLEVYRYETDEILEGQLNGRPLEATGPSEQPEPEEAETSDPETSDAESEYVVLTDDAETLQVEIPGSWTDTSGSGWEYEGETVGSAVRAAPDLDEYQETWETPGMFFGASTSLASEYTPDTLLDEFQYDGECEKGERLDYSDQAYTGKSEQWNNCGGTGTSFAVIAAVPEDESYITFVQVQVVSEPDADALTRIMETFVVSDPSGL
ncbi:S1C family serine protease [Rubrobacter indicoceani]|uniref:S1C family serine protease n=1 Tax=Rubrobacter indicoceani TaxID=2051957 RepID=UPI0013C3FEF6|nr:S1C family serine protease [Rubrobacter indicoceani]